MGTELKAGEDEAASDAEAAESERHAWLAGMVVVVGVALLVAPSGVIPEFVPGIGPVLVVLGIVGLVIQWTYKRQR